MTEEKYTIRKYKRILFYVVILVLLAAFVLGQRIYPSERDTVTEESITFTGTFYRVLADGTEEEIPVPGKCDVPAGELLVIRSVLPQDYKDNTIAIRSSLENVRIYIGGELRTVYDTENTRSFGKNSASRYVFCETSGEDAGKEVRIELQSFTHKYSGVVNTVYCGDKLDIWAYMFHCYFMVTLIACTMLFAGLVVLIISLVLDIVYKTRFDLEYLGWCMILGAVWMLGESKLRQLFVSNASILSNMCFFVVMICPIPILFYIDSVQQGRYRKVYHVAECITCVNLVLCTALQVLNIADFIFVPHGDRRNLPDGIYHHLQGSYSGNSEALQASVDRTGGCHDRSHAGGDSSVSCCVSVRNLYRNRTGGPVGRYSDPDNGPHPRAGAGQAERGKGKPGLSDRSSYAS